MAGSVFGTLFRVSTFGESHGPALGCVIDGCPAGLALDEGLIAAALARRRPGVPAGALEGRAVDAAGRALDSAARGAGAAGFAGAGPASARFEADEPEILSGLFEGRTTGAPIAILVRSRGARSSDYEAFRGVFRPGRGDYGWCAKYGRRDHRGGGRLSGRETAARVAAGAVALAFLRAELSGFELWAYTLRAGGVSCPPGSGAEPSCRAEVERNAMRAPDAAAAARMLEAVAAARAAGDSVGGVVECRARGLPPGLGEPVFAGLDAALAGAILSVPGVKGFELGAGFAAADMRGSAYLDPARPGPAAASSPDALAFPSLVWEKNDAGGVAGGLSTGADLVFRAALKPTPTVAAAVASADEAGNRLLVSGEGVSAAGGAAPRPAGASPGALARHDACLCPRAVPVVEAMAALVLADALLQGRAARVRRSPR